MPGTTHATITRIFSQLEQQGLIHCLLLRRMVLKKGDRWHDEI